MGYTNLIGYKFTKITNLESMQQTLREQCLALDLKGTILLSQEGINLFLSGHNQALDAFSVVLSQAHIPPIDFKKSTSLERPFNRMLVKIKPEIIPLGVPLSLTENPAPHLAPHIFQQWLEQNKPMVILDTRNTYEVRLGKFREAIHLNIQHFRHFKEAIKQLPPEYKNQPIVTYCTGGIRCEKAAPFLISQGFKEVYQLEGGILKYLEKCQASHFEGECFMFDKRIALNHHLAQTNTIQCRHCRQPVTQAEQNSPFYQPGTACPACYEKPVT